MDGDARDIAGAVFDVGDEVGEGGGEGGEGLAAGESPAAGSIRCECGGGATAAAGRAHFGLGGDVVDEGAVFDDVSEDAVTELVGPALGGGFGAGGHEVHADGEGGGAVALRERELGEDDIGEAVAATAVLGGDGGGEVAGVAHSLEVLVGEGGIAVVVRGGGGELGGELLGGPEEGGLGLGVGEHRRRVAVTFLAGLLGRGAADV